MPRDLHKEWSSENHKAAIPGRVKLRIWERHGGTCQGPCHRKLRPADKVHHDHKIPLEDGGEHAEGNLQLMCDGCHALKTGIEATARAKVRAIKRRHLGIKPEPKMKFSKRFDGTVTKWNPQTRRYEPLPR